MAFREGDRVLVKFSTNGAPAKWFPGTLDARPVPANTAHDRVRLQVTFKDGDVMAGNGPRSNVLRTDVVRITEEQYANSSKRGSLDLPADGVQTLDE